MKCLVVEPSMVTRRAIANALRPLSPEIVEAQTADEALAACDDSIEIVVTGWSDGGVDGPDVVRRLKSREGMTAPRCVIVSPNHQREQVLAAIAAGVDAYVLRPFDPEVLRDRVSALLAPATRNTAEGGEKLAA
jgi:two-component system chemotaxis response regulator CheY